MNDNKTDNVADISKNMGERLTMFYLYHYLGWDVEFVDYVGADLIAIDRSNQTKYAVSVKTRKMGEKWTDEKVKPESRSITTFSDTDAHYLRCFANDMKMEPIVAYLVIFQRTNKERGKNSAFLFLIGLDDLEEMRNDDTICFVNGHKEKKETKNGIKFDTGFRLSFGGEKEATLKQLCSDPRVTWFKMEIDDYQIADKYNINPRNRNDHLIKEHWKIQQGTFGEYLVLWYLGKNHNMRGFHVDSSGADLVLLDADNPEDVNEQYAVSVKTFTYEIDRLSYQFENKFEKNLNEYINRWTLNNEEAMKPLLCFNCVRYDNDKHIEKIYMIAFKIQDIEKETNRDYLKRTRGGIVIKYDDASLDKMKKDPSIIYNEIDFTNHNFNFS